MRCSKIFRRPAFEDLQPDSGDPEQSVTNSTQPSSKKQKKGTDSETPSTEKDAALALQALGLQKPASSHSSSTAGSTMNGNGNGSRSSATFDSHASDANTSEDTPSSEQHPQNEEYHEDEIEFVCVIRPADASIPEGSHLSYQPYLSTASMVEHDRQRDEKMIGDTSADAPRGGSPSCSLSNDSGSDDKFGSRSGSSGQSNHKVSNGTSSEAGSDESDSA
jgi:hypothetical protein